MKATMNAGGVITIEPETGAEAYALRNWANQNLIPEKDLDRNEGAYFRGSGLTVQGHVAPAGGGRGDD